MTDFVKKGIRFITAVLLLSVVSCHSGYISLDCHIHNEACYNTDSSLVAFMATKRAYLKPKGIATFPDGGQSKVITHNTDLYIYHIENKTIQNEWHLDDLTRLKPSLLSSIRIKMFFTDSALVFRIAPVTHWDFFLKYARSGSDSLNIETARNHYSQPLEWRYEKQEINQIGSTEFDALSNRGNRISLTKLKNLVSEIPLSHLGLNIMDIFPKPEKAYINETIYLKNDSSTSRRAVIEQIISKLDKGDIRKLLKRMDNHLKRLEGQEEMNYRQLSGETYEKIRALIK